MPGRSAYLAMKPQHVPCTAQSACCSTGIDCQLEGEPYKPPGPLHGQSRRASSARYCVFLRSAVYTANRKASSMPTRTAASQGGESRATDVLKLSFRSFTGSHCGQQRGPGAGND